MKNWTFGRWIAVLGVAITGLTAAIDIAFRFFPNTTEVRILDLERISDIKFNADTMTNSVVIPFQQFQKLEEKAIGQDKGFFKLPNLDRPKADTNVCEESTAELDTLVDIIDFLYERGNYRECFVLAELAYGKIVGHNCGKKVEYHSVGPRLNFNFKKVCAVLVEGYMSQGRFEEAGVLGMMLCMDDDAVTPYYQALSFVAMVRRYGRKIGIVLPLEWEVEWWKNKIVTLSPVAQRRFLNIVAGWGYLPPYAYDAKSKSLQKLSYADLWDLPFELQHLSVDFNDRVRGGVIAKSWTGFNTYEQFSLADEMGRQCDLIHASGCSRNSKLHCSYPIIWYGNRILYLFSRRMWMGKPEIRRDADSTWPIIFGK